MALDLTSTQRVADLILREERSESLVEFLTRLRHNVDQPASYDTIGRELYLATNGEVAISYQTVKRWLLDLGVIEEATA